TGEVLEVRRGAKWTVDARRADLELVRLRDRVLDIEHGTQLAREILAVLEIDPVARNFRQVRDLAERNIDLDAQHPPALLEQEAHVDQLEPGRLKDGLDDRDQALVKRIARHIRAKKKVAGRPPLPRSDMKLRDGYHRTQSRARPFRQTRSGGRGATGGTPARSGCSGGPRAGAEVS